MAKRVVDRLRQQFGERILEHSDHRGDEQVVVAPSDWKAVATFLRDDEQTAMNQFIDLTAVDYPEREPDLPRFDVVLIVRSLEKKHRIRVKTRVGDGQPLDSLVGVWVGANWAEREVWDMFGIRFQGHPDLRRILLYEEFEGHPLRKDYPIDRPQPLVPYREVPDLEKLPPYGVEEGQPWTRVDWSQRLAGEARPVSPALSHEQGYGRMHADAVPIGTERRPLPPTAGVAAEGEEQQPS